MEDLPHDVLGAILRRLETPRVLASSRCVCKTWRALIDAHGLPISLSGIFTHPSDERLPDYFALPHQSSSTQIPAAAFDRLDTDGDDPLMVVQHCNGLLLLGNGVSSRVLNPATGQWARLTSPPPLRLFGTDDFYGYEEDPDYDCEDSFLVFDPTVSPHYHVLLINSVPFTPSWPDCQVLRPSAKEREWPPSSYTMRVFSSETSLWEKKQFMRQGEARGTVQDMLWCSSLSYSYAYAAYWRGSLYVHQRDFVMRINLSDYTYQVINLPQGDLEQVWTDWYLGKSNGGVYCALFKVHGGLRLQVWFLDETCGHMKWALKRDVDLSPLLSNFPTHHDEGYMSNLVRRSLSILGFHPSKGDCLHTYGFQKSNCLSVQ